MVDSQLTTKRESVGISVKIGQVSEDKKVVIPQYPLIQFADIPDGIKSDIVDIVVDSTDRHSTDPEAASKSIKDQLDKNYNPNWHVIVGDNFGFDVSYEPRSLLYLFNGPVAVAIWKCN